MKLSVVLFPLFAVARAYSYDPESSEVVEAEGSPLQCYVSNETGTVTLETCGNPNIESAFLEKPRPVCMAVRTRKGKTTHYCTILHPLAAAACDPRACLENSKAFFSDCCCLYSGCNQNMLPRPEQ